ncbi:MAG: D-alanyl-D-alanine carboxypeptidase [Candidatus Magasanikbacteria bacterium]|nr:D-alanyl-D-alanine carboxypeptidase [Candidatus Magasanikbacteria bacterium]
MQFQVLALFIASFVLALPWWAGYGRHSLARTPEAIMSVAALQKNAKVNEKKVVPRGSLYARFPVSPERETPRLVGPSSFQKEITAQSALVIDSESKAILYKKNIDEVRSIGSITKLLTVLTVFDLNPDWSKEVTLESVDGDTGPLIVQAGDVVSRSDLLHIGLVASSNNAINALVRSTGLTYAEFAARMNEKAAELGLNTSRFVEPTGLDKENKSTAGDVSRLAVAALSNDEIRRITSMTSYNFRVRNTNKMRVARSTDLLLSTSGFARTPIARVVGGKTGFIDEAGYCFVVEVEGPNKQRLIVVVLGSRDHWSRFAEAADLAAWAFKNFEWPEKTALGG